MTITARQGVAALAVICVSAVSAATGLRIQSRKPGYCGSCQSCHPRSMGDLLHDIAVTLSGNHPASLPPRPKLAKEQCLACHRSYASLAERTAHLRPNPHASHLGEDEECYQCHKMHRRSPGLKYCSTCHHTGELVKCGRCHKDRKSNGYRTLR